MQRARRMPQKHTDWRLLSASTTIVLRNVKAPGSDRSGPIWPSQQGIEPWRSNAPHSVTITIDGKTYDHDVVIRLSGKIVKRKKKLSKKYYGTSHVLSKDEAKFVFEKGCEQLIIGSGQVGNVHLSPEAEAYFAKKGCKVLLQPTHKAIDLFNGSKARKVGLFHVTC